MTHVDTQWALRSILQLSQHQRRATVVSSPTAATMMSSNALCVTAVPRIMQTADCSRVLLLARRPNGIAGVEVGYGNRIPWVASHSFVKEQAKTSKKVRLLTSYLQRRGFETVPTSSPFFAASRAPLLLHTNHFIGWKLNPGLPAFPLYAHSFHELQRLRGKEMAALRPDDCLVANAYTEWDNWREVLGEPGWDFFSASDATIERMVHDGIAAPLVDAQDGVCRVEVP